MNSMECSCACDLYDPCEFFNVKDVKARKEHKCCACGETIQVGQIYEYTTYKFEGIFITDKTCLTCVRIRNDFCGPMGEGLQDHILECLGVNYVTGEIDDD
jgi:hypothetical protein